MLTTDAPETTTTPDGPRVVRLLDLDPDLARGIARDEASEAARWTAGVLVDVPIGRVDPASFARGLEGAFAALVVDGFLLRRCDLAAHPATQLIGPGDVLCLRGEDTDLPAITAQALTPLRIAVLDRRFVAAGRRWPWLLTRVLRRLGQASDRALALHAVSHQPRADERVAALLDHLAARWGRVVPEGTLVPVPLTHSQLGTLVGARRPTVTLAVGELEEAGTLQRDPRGWVLPRQSGRFARTGGARSTPSSSARPYIR